MNTDEGTELDEIDEKIIEMLQEDSRKPFVEIAKELGVSDPTIHVRVKKTNEDLRDLVAKGIRTIQITLLIGMGSEKLWYRQKEGIGIVQRLARVLHQ